jgi:hypothetical protein
MKEFLRIDEYLEEISWEEVVICLKEGLGRFKCKNAKLLWNSRPSCAVDL